jgi:hypothetical protein
MSWEYTDLPHQALPGFTLIDLPGEAALEFIKYQAPSEPLLIVNCHSMDRTWEFRDQGRNVRTWPHVQALIGSPRITYEEARQLVPPPNPDLAVREGL